MTCREGVEIEHDAGEQQRHARHRAAQHAQHLLHGLRLLVILARQLIVCSDDDASRHIAIERRRLA